MTYAEENNRLVGTDEPMYADLDWLDELLDEEAPKETTEPDFSDIGEF